MRLIYIFSLLFLFCYVTLSAGPLISEISAGGQSDWVEITLSENSGSCDISNYFVTMYTGSNEKIAASPVTLENRDLPGTPYDDRFAVVHFTDVPSPDETDISGDINGNGIRDLYCRNYGLWNSDCAVSIDTDDSPSNGGIIDFAAYSSMDGSMNSVIGGYISTAAGSGHWEGCSGADIQQCCIDIGADGLNSSSTISRAGRRDTNSSSDFSVTPYATPGRENIITVNRGNRKLFRPGFKKTSYIYGGGTIRLPLFIYETCSVKVRIFNSTGFTVYSSELREDLNPGDYSFEIQERNLRGKVLTGLYPVRIEAAGKHSRSENAVIFLAIVRNRQR